MNFTKKIELLKTGLQAIEPAATVTRNYHLLDTNDDKPNGPRIYAIVSAGFQRFSMGTMAGEDATHDIIVIGQQKVRDDVPGNEIEDIEFAMIEKIQELVVSDCWDSESLAIKLNSVKQSMQQDGQYASVACFMSFDELD